ncbi:small RNA degrading nuclease 3 [Striga asiatica]|uniref:Small RNA degrading nuclease 3 n=1 Tax=Striga asiatica TaxID=4170 RepID=A0A5A7QDZ3_STRAF|nr:small RNA degrading nuclease 3 [Striga asiatica]
MYRICGCLVLESQEYHEIEHVIENHLNIQKSTFKCEGVNKISKNLHDKLEAEDQIMSNDRMKIIQKFGFGNGIDDRGINIHTGKMKSLFSFLLFSFCSIYADHTILKMCYIYILENNGMNKQSGSIKNL